MENPQVPGVSDSDTQKMVKCRLYVSKPILKVTMMSSVLDTLCLKMVSRLYDNDSKHLDRLCFKCTFGNLTYKWYLKAGGMDEIFSERVSSNSSVLRMES